MAARGALHDVTALRGDRRRGAAAAEAIVLLPVDHGSRVGEQARLFGRQLARDQPQVVQLRAAPKRRRRLGGPPSVLPARLTVRASAVADVAGVVIEPSLGAVMGF